MALRLTQSQYNQLAEGKPIKSRKAPTRKPIAVKFQPIEKKRSYAERVWQREGAIVMQDATGVPILRTIYEPFELALPGGRRYTPDWLLIDKYGTCLIVATKGKRAKKLAGYRDSRAALKECAELYPWARFFQADYQHPNWIVTEIIVEREKE